jgi:hypothetical protein
MPIADCEHDSSDFDPTTSHVTGEGKGSILFANVTTGQLNGNNSHMQIEIVVGYRISFKNNKLLGVKRYL